MDPSDSPPPARVGPSPLTDALRIARLTEKALGSLTDRLAEFQPTTSGLDMDDVLEMAASAGVHEATVRSVLRLATYLTADGRSPEQIKTLAGNVAELSKGTLEVSRVERVLALLRSKAGDLATQYGVLEEIESAMPSLRYSSVASNLRKLSVPTRGSDLAPVAIVRLTLDEGDAVVFQCVPRMLDQLRKVLDEAAGDLAELAALAQSRKEET